MAERKSLLGRIGGGIQGVLGNPVVQGLGVAAATGFNPLLGLAAVPQLSAMRQGMADDNERRRQRMIQRQALQRLPALLQDTSVVQGQGGQMPLESVSGPAEQIQIPGRKAQVQTVNTPQGHRELQGVLAQAAPSGVAGLLAEQVFPAPQQTRTPNSIAELDALGLPRTPEGLAELQEIKNRMSPEDKVSLDLAVENLEQLRDERRREQEERGTEKKTAQFDVQDTLRQGREILSLTEKLEGTFLEPGGFMSGERRGIAALASEGAGVLGFDEFSKRQKQTIENFDKFKKNATDFVIGMTDQFGTRLTNFQLETLQKASAGEDVTPAAIKSIITDTLRRTLARADIEDFEVPERQKFEDLLKRFSRGEKEDLGDGVTLEFID